MYGQLASVMPPDGGVVNALPVLAPPLPPLEELDAEASDVHTGGPRVGQTHAPLVQEQLVSTTLVVLSQAVTVTSNGHCRFSP